MKRKILSMLVCAVVASSQIISTGVTAFADNILQSYSIAQDVVKNIAPDMIVDGSFLGNNGDEVEGIKTYKTLKAAIDKAPSKSTEAFKILIKNGTYKEKIKIYKPNITLIGESAEDTILTYDDAAGTIKREEDGGNGTATYGTGGSPSIYVGSSAAGFTAANLTIENAFDEAANASMKSKQAIAIMSDADKSLFVNCRFIGNQDTLCPYTNRQYFYNCYIEGDVDFIFGRAQAVFEECEIFSVNREGITPKGYITAPNTAADKEFGYLILNSKLTSNITEPGTVYLGRPWHPNGIENSSIVYKNCEMGSHISSIGWTTMSGNKPEDNRMYEYNSTGEGAIESATRPVLSDEEASKYTKENVLNGWDTDNSVRELLDYIDAIKNENNKTNASPEVNVVSKLCGSTIAQTYTVTPKGGDIDLSKLKLVYKAECLNDEKQNIYCDHAALELNCAPWYVSLKDKVEGVFADNALELTINDDNILAEDTGRLIIKIRISKEDYSRYNEVGEDLLQVYYDGKLIEK